MLLWPEEADTGEHFPEGVENVGNGSCGWRSVFAGDVMQEHLALGGGVCASRGEPPGTSCIVSGLRCLKHQNFRSI